MSRNGGDSYRPSARPDSYQPRYSHDLPPRPPKAAGDAMYHFGGDSRGLRKPREFWSRPKIHERDLLTHIPSTRETPVFVPTTGGSRFKDLETIPNGADEVEDDNGDNMDRTKRRKLDNGPDVEIEPPKWSNPDPYTSLPPPPDTTGTRVDVVKLIRKARNEHAVADNAMAAQDDFISFDFAHDPFLDPPLNAPSGPKADLPRKPPPSMPVGDDVNDVEIVSVRPLRVLGKRKRGDDDDTLMGDVSRGQYHANGQPLAAWSAAAAISSTPWLRSRNTEDSPMVALHKEIIDFYGWVKPQEYERIVREDIISRIKRELVRLHPGDLQAFGSYAAGLYLPTGDMDLVYMMLAPMSKSKLHRFSNFIERSDLAVAGSVKTIAFARVPIIKFVDARTGIRVDLSFNNDTGTTAIETFKEWQGKRSLVITRNYLLTLYSKVPCDAYSCVNCQAVSDDSWSE